MSHPSPMHLINSFLTADKSWAFISLRVLLFPDREALGGDWSSSVGAPRAGLAQLEWDLQPLLRQGGHHTLHHPTGRHLVSWTIL